MKSFPDFKFEKIYWDRGFDVVGIDEVGRGAFAGPVTVAGVMFDSGLNNKLLSLGINDSKKLTPKKREYLSSKIKELADKFYVSFIDVLTINKIGIGKATFLGMKEVYEKIYSQFVSKNIDPGPASQMTKEKKLFALIDAFEIPNVSFFQKGIIRGDSLSVSIAAASIIAKVARDSLMTELSKDFPLYAFEKHKGYGTALHRSLIQKNGLSSLHRLEFCRKTLAYTE